MDDLLLIRFLEKQTTLEEARYVLKWIEASEKNKKYFQHLHTIWVFVQMDRAVNVDEEHISQIMRKIDKQRNHFRKLCIKFGSVAAVILVLFGIYNWFNKEKQSLDYELLVNSASHSKEITLTMNSERDILAKDEKTVILTDSIVNVNYAKRGQVTINDTLKLEANSVINTIRVPYGKRSVLILEDSTKVHLNSGSTLIYPSLFTNNERRVFLEGEAFFEVNQDAGRKFIVQTTYKTVHVLGTSFNVSIDKEQACFETVLVTGRVLLDNKDNPIELTPNECFSYNNSNGEYFVKDVDVSNYISWIYGKLRFKKEQMRNVLKKLEKVYNIKITLKDEKYGQSLVSGELNMKDSPEETLKLLMHSVTSTDDRQESIFRISFFD